MLNLARPLQREALLLSTRLRKMDDEKIFGTEKIFHTLLPAAVRAMASSHSLVTPR